MGTTDKREEILEFIKKNGPALPIHISKAISQNTLFAGAFLSELYKEKAIIMSNMRVGSSPLYLISGQEPMLENFIQHIKGKEKEALLLLKKNKILEDKNLHPAIRVALRSLKDFAIPLRFNNEIFWRYFTLNNQETEALLHSSSPQPPTQQLTTPVAPIPQVEIPEPVISKSIIKPILKIKEISSEILKQKAEQEIEKQVLKEAKEDEDPQEDAPIIKKIIKPKRTKKLDPKEKFLEEIKLTLGKKQVEIVEIEKNDKKQILGKVIADKTEYILVAFNKKRFDEADLLRIYRKYSDSDTPFYFLSKGELSKKTMETIKASKRLKAVGIFEE